MPTHDLVLLPAFDPYLLAHRDKAHLVAEAQYKAVYRSGGWVAATVLWRGRVAATWSHGRHGKWLDVVVSPFSPLPGGAQAGLEAEAADLGRFLGLAARVGVA